MGCDEGAVKKFENVVLCLIVILVENSNQAKNLRLCLCP